MSDSARIGLIAGAGNLPLHFARCARLKGLSLATIAVRGAASPALEKLSDKFLWVSPGQVGALLSFFRREKVARAVMHGKVQHFSVFKDFRMDWKALSLWMTLKDHSGGSILNTLSAELARKGTKLMDGRFLMEDLMAAKGLLTKTAPKQEEKTAGTYGVKMARSLAKLEIGQTILVKKSSVAAVEAMEGTDEAILRAGKIAGPGVILIKVASPEQDWRFDIPTIGPKTLQSLVRVKAGGIVLESGRCFLLEREKLVLEADRHGVFIIAV